MHPDGYTPHSISARESTLGAGGWHLRDRPANLARRGRSGFKHPVLHINGFVTDSLAGLAAGRGRQQYSESRSNSNAQQKASHSRGPGASALKSSGGGFQAINSIFILAGHSVRYIVHSVVEPVGDRAPGFRLREKHTQLGGQAHPILGCVHCSSVSHDDSPFLCIRRLTAVTVISVRRPHYRLIRVERVRAVRKK